MSRSPQPMDVAGLLDGLTQLVDLVNAGEAGPSGLQFAAELAHAATGAAGASFVEFGESVGRIVVTTAGMSWALGRPVDVTHPAVARVLAGPRDQQLAVEDLDDATARLLGGRGLRRVVKSLAITEGRVVGSLQVYFTDPDVVADGYQVSVVRLLAACAAHLYRESAGLPIYPDGPALAPLVEGLAVVGPDAIVRSWSPAAARITGRTFEEAFGRPLPFPVPARGRTLVHRLDDNRWIKARATTLAGTDASVVTFRATVQPQPREGPQDLFIAVTSHELRTPVTVIRGYADTLVEHWESLDEGARREAVHVLGQRARDLSRLVDRLLHAATDIAGLVESTAGVPFDLVDALRDAAGELSPQLRRSLRLELPSGLPKALGDRTSLATALTELVTNACKYSTDWVEVELTAGADAQTVWFRVADRGLGIQPEHGERAFDRFWQRDTGDQRRYGGVGLGLYLVRRIVERQNGWVSLRPRDGGGTVAEVRLPRADTSPEEA